MTPHYTSLAETVLMWDHIIHGGHNIDLYVETPHLNCLNETVPIKGHNINYNH